MYLFYFQSSNCSSHNASLPPVCTWRWVRFVHPLSHTALAAVRYASPQRGVQQDTLPPCIVCWVRFVHPLSHAALAAAHNALHRSVGWGAAGHSPSLPCVLSAFCASLVSRRPSCSAQCIASQRGVGCSRALSLPALCAHKPDKCLI